MRFKIRYHQVSEGHFLTEDAFLEQESFEDVLQIMFRCVPGLRWVRYEGKNYGKPAEKNWQWPWFRKGWEDR